MILNLEKVTELCVKFKITAEQFYFMYGIVHKEWNKLGEYVKVNGGLSHNKIKDLEKKGILLNYNTDDVDPDTGNPIVMTNLLYPTPEFEQAIFLDPQEAFEMLLEVFPYNITWEGKTFNARTGQHPVLKNLLSKYTKNDVTEIQRIIELTKYGKDNNLIPVGLEKYIYNKYWNAIEETKNRNAGLDQQGFDSYE